MVQEAKKATKKPAGTLAVVALMATAIVGGFSSMANAAGGDDDFVDVALPTDLSIAVLCAGDDITAEFSATPVANNYDTSWFAEAGIPSGDTISGWVGYLVNGERVLLGSGDSDGFYTAFHGTAGQRVTVPLDDVSAPHLAKGDVLTVEIVNANGDDSVTVTKTVDYSPATKPGLSVKVQDAQGRPLKGIPVSVTFEDPNYTPGPIGGTWSGKDWRMQESDANGIVHFSFADAYNSLERDVITPGEYVLVAGWSPGTNQPNTVLFEGYGTSAGYWPVALENEGDKWVVDSVNDVQSVTATLSAFEAPATHEFVFECTPQTGVVANLTYREVIPASWSAASGLSDLTHLLYTGVEYTFFNDENVNWGEWGINEPGTTVENNWGSMTFSDGDVFETVLYPFGRESYTTTLSYADIVAACSAPTSLEEEDLTEANRGDISVPSTATVGASITVEVGTGFAGDEVSAWGFSTPVSLGNHTVSAAGTIQVTLPASMRAGAHKIAVLDAAGAILGWDDIVLTAAGNNQVPGGATGLDERQGGIGVLLGALGAVVVTGLLVGRRGIKQR